MKYLVYSEYKPSGVEWLGQIPEHWKTVPVKRNYEIQLGKMLQNNPASDGDISVPYIKALYVHWGKVDTLDLPYMWASPADHKQFGIKSGDLLICEGGEAGRAGIVDSAPDPCIIQNALHRVRGKAADIRFLQYVLQTVSSGGWFDVLCNKATIAHFTREKLAELRMPMPPSIEEQHTIAAFLDRETTRIDTLIEKKERQIELLQEKRSALISHVLTKGLNPNVKMKNSGVEWLGEIPEHWKTVPVKRNYEIQLGKMLQNNPASDGDISVPYIKALYVHWGKVATSDLPDMWASPADLKQFGVKGGDLLVCEGGEAGRAGIVDSAPDPCIIQNALHRVRGKDADVRFLQYLLQTVSSGGWFDVLCNKATIAHFTREKLAELRMPMPPSIEEQHTIAAFLDRETARIDTLIEKIRKSIDLLREYRTALLSAAVTGKIDIRKEVA